MSDKHKAKRISHIRNYSALISTSKNEIGSNVISFNF
jgi:hypothetical protein